MNELIASIFNTLQDYRSDEASPSARMTTERIRHWIMQFDSNLRIPILTEMDNIFKKRYYSKVKIQGFLDRVITVLTEKLDFKTPLDFLRNSNFLSLQPPGKSQYVMLKLFDTLIQTKYKISLTECGISSKRYSIYIDDILCTGLTLINDIKKWIDQKFSLEKTNQQAIADNSTKLIFAYLFIHQKNYQKKVIEMRYKISNEVSKNHTMYRLLEIENENSSNSKIDLILPIENSQPKNVIDYKNSITTLVDNHTRTQFNKSSPEEFFRSVGFPQNEQFFTNSKNRILVENSFLQKGIEILNNSNVTIKNIRALGFSFPSQKNFGFGALCFTWRNVPNNAPLVFWYSGGGFTPLFEVKRSGNQLVNFIPTDDDLTL